MFLLNSILLGIGLAMDAFSVSLANGMSEPEMNRKKMMTVAGVYAGFQFLMPMTGWLCVHTVVSQFRTFQTFIPWIAFILLAWIGGKMFWEGMHPQKKQEHKKKLLPVVLLTQGVATSIDALSVGFAIADDQAAEAVLCALMIAAVTFCICMSGLILGKKAGTRLSGKAEILGGLILIGIGLEIFITG